jgi:cyanophycin synthetase
MSLARVPLTHGGRVGFQVENVLAAAAGAWALGIPHDKIRAGLTTFSGGLGQVPARFNLLDLNGVAVLFDYGHNTSALRRLLEVVRLFPHQRRSIVYSAAGDRRDADIVEQGTLLGEAFDRVVLYEDTYLRGRAEGEITNLFRQGLQAGGRTREVHAVRGGLAAVQTALDLAAPGEFLMIQPDLIEETAVYLQERLSTSGGREMSLDEALTAEPAVEVREGALGKCVHATRKMAAGEVIMKAWGEPVACRTRHSIQVDVDLHIVVPAPLQLLNHSCEPNCGLLIRCGVEEMELHTLRPIEPGEELTLDYETFEDDIQFMTGPCQCGTAACRNRITGYRGLSRAKRDAYGVYVAEHLRLHEARNGHMVRPSGVPQGA